MSTAVFRRNTAAAGAEIVNDSSTSATSTSASASLNNTANIQTAVDLTLDSLESVPPPSHNPSLSSTTDLDLSLKQNRGHQHQPTMVSVNATGVPAQPDALSDTMEKMKITNEEARKKQAAAAAAALALSQPAPTSSSTSSSSLSSPSSKRSDKPSASVSYAAERVIGNGSFGVVYQASIMETGETVAIKKVLQDQRFKNRELQIMSCLDHPDVVRLKHCFYSKGEKPEEVYLNLVMEYIPETVHRTLRNHTKANKLVPILYTKVYMWQICRSVAYIHSLGISHRDIKPQNLLLNPKTHNVKLCDFGSAKKLVPGEPNVSYICSRYYRAPELVFEATEYTTAIDVWSVGCVMAELMLGNPLFPGESGVDQLIEIIKVLGTPSKEEIFAMNPNHNSFKFPQIKPHPWVKVFRNKAPANAIDLVSRFLRYDPTTRVDLLEALSHPFFDELREPGVKLPNGKDLPDLFSFTENELRALEKRGSTKKVLPPHIYAQLKLPTPK